MMYLLFSFNEAERLQQCGRLYLDKLHTINSSAIHVCTLVMLQGICKMTHMNRDSHRYCQCEQQLHDHILLDCCCGGNLKA